MNGFTLLAIVVVIGSVLAVTCLDHLTNRYLENQEASRCADFDALMGPLLDNAGMQYPEGHACAKYL